VSSETVSTVSNERTSSASSEVASGDLERTGGFAARE
jgi:hypothetical protein